MAEETANPIQDAKPPVGNPMGSTLKLKPVIRKPMPGGAGLARPGIKLPTSAPASSPAAPAPAATASDVAPVINSTSTLEQLRSATQKLKGLTQQIPQQAILHKTGIIAEEALTEAQKQASKSRTARISLSDAMGVAPVKNEPVPMKTIRIKRPSDIIAPSAMPRPAQAAAAPVASAEPEKVVEETKLEPPVAKSEQTVTQRKTLKIARPGAGISRPGPKLNLKKPGAAPSSDAKDSDVAPVANENAEVADIADIPEISAVSPFASQATAMCPPNRIPDVPPTCQFIGLMVQIASCVAMGFLAWKLYEVTLLPAYCGGGVM